MMRVFMFMAAALVIVAVAERMYTGKSTSVSSVLGTFEKIGEGTYSKIRGWIK